ncbi:MAG TPA: hypothetical protein V6D05_05505 [Stenomitos sp.]
MAGLIAGQGRPAKAPATPTPSLPATAPLKVNDVAREGSGEWLLREFARSNQKFTSFKQELARPWWKLW